jgi:hypothetical protein
LGDAKSTGEAKSTGDDFNAGLVHTLESIVDEMGTGHKDIAVRTFDKINKILKDLGEDPIPERRYADNRRRMQKQNAVKNHVKGVIGKLRR